MTALYYATKRSNSTQEKETAAQKSHSCHSLHLTHFALTEYNGQMQNLENT